MVRDLKISFLPTACARRSFNTYCMSTLFLDQYFSPEYVSPRLDPKSRLISVKSPKCNMYTCVFGKNVGRGSEKLLKASGKGMDVHSEI